MTMKWPLLVVMLCVLCAMVHGQGKGKGNVHCGPLGKGPHRELCGAGTSSAQCCAFGEKCCSGSCVSVRSNDNNCGACGNKCPADRTCVRGSCVCRVGRACGVDKCCAFGLKCCSGSCVSLRSNDNNCGACGNKCPADRTCSRGKCVCRVGRACGVDKCCAFGEKCCSGSCVSLRSNDNNCGACGNKCPAGSTCVQGRCACPGKVCGKYSFACATAGRKCACTTTAEGPGFCANGRVSCALLKACTDSTECTLPHRCVKSTCCPGKPDVCLLPCNLDYPRALAAGAAGGGQGDPFANGK
jgi:hypothetical protein